MENEITINGVTYIKKEEPKTVKQKKVFRLEWGETASGTMTWEKAKKWCENKGNGWRMPTRMELEIAYLENITGFEKSYFYWSATEYSASFACYRDFGTGTESGSSKANSYRIRCVRDY